MSYVEKILNGKDPAKMGKGFWNDLAVNWDLSEEDMRKYEDFFNWRKLSDHQKMSESFIRENVDRVHWDRISQRIQMSEQFIEEFANKVIWDYIWSYQKHLSCAFIEHHLKGHGRVDWDRIVRYQKLDERFIFNHFNELSLDTVLEYQKLPRELFDKIVAFGKLKYSNNKTDLENFERNVYWRKICRWRNVEEEEIMRYLKLRGEYGWYTILEYQTLSEDWLEKHYKKIKKASGLWYLVRYQKLSEDFIKRHEEDIDYKGSNNYWFAIKNNNKIKKTDWIKNKIK